MTLLPRLHAWTTVPVKWPYLTDSSLNSSTIVTGGNNGWLVPDAVNTVICAPDDGWRNHPKHIEQFTDKINCVHFNHVGLSLTYFNVALQTKKNQSLCNKSDQSETNLQWYYVLHQLIHSPSLVQNTLLTESQSFLTLSGWTTYIYVAQWAL